MKTSRRTSGCELTITGFQKDVLINGAQVTDEHIEDRVRGDFRHWRRFRREMMQMSLLQPEQLAQQHPVGGKLPACFRLRRGKLVELERLARDRGLHQNGVALSDGEQCVKTREHLSGVRGRGDYGFRIQGLGYLADTRGRGEEVREACEKLR